MNWQSKFLNSTMVLLYLEQGKHLNSIGEYMVEARNQNPNKQLFKVKKLTKMYLITQYMWEIWTEVLLIKSFFKYLAGSLKVSFQQE